MRIVFLAVMLVAGAVHAQGERPSATDAQAKVPAVEFRSAFEGYRPFADPEMRDWRKSNGEVAKPTSKPQPGKPGSTK